MPSLGLGLGIGKGSDKLPYNSYAQAWFTAVEATGATILAANKNSISRFFSALSSGGVLSSIQQANLFLGSSNLAGALVPIVGKTPTNGGGTAFTDADYNRLTGLKANASNQYLKTGQSNPDATVTSRHIYVCTTANATTTTTNAYLIGSGNASGDTRIWQPSVAAGSLSMGIVSGTTTVTPTFNQTNGWGISRPDASTIIPYINATQTSIANTITTPTSTEFGVFATGTGVGKTDARIAFYSIGTYADLSVIDTAIKNLLAVIV